MRETRADCSYRMYGLALKSHVTLSCLPDIAPSPHEVELVRGPIELFAQARKGTLLKWASTDWFHYQRLDNGSDYLRWKGLCEFLVSTDGRQIAYLPSKGIPHETFQTYLISQALSFSLLKLGMEPLHATTVVVKEQAIALLGNSGDGKSSLGAAFLQAGHKILTDDLLVIKEDESGKGFLAFPGPPRIKLFPNTSQCLFGTQVMGIPMNQRTKKQIIPLNSSQYSQSPTPLRAIYILRRPSKPHAIKGVTTRRLPSHRAMLHLISNTFNHMVVNPGRLTRQFHQAGQLASTLPVKSLSYPRNLKRLPEVLEAITSDLAL